MAQLNFANNGLAGLYNPQNFLINNGSLSFFPFTPTDSISFLTFNGLMQAVSAANFTVTMSIGLYSLTGATLSLANSITGTRSSNDIKSFYLTATATSATQNITPGTWWFGILATTGGHSVISFIGQTIVNPSNAFPGSFIGGRMTDSTNALPSSYATSDLDITGTDAMAIPYIILTA